MQAGIDKAITLYTAIPWGDRFRYKDEATGNYVYETWAPGSKLLRWIWNCAAREIFSEESRAGTSKPWDLNSTRKCWSAPCAK